MIAAARKTGCLVDARSVPGTRYTLRTGESEVRLVQKEQVYYKIKNPFAKAHLKKHLLSSALADDSAVNELVYAVRSITDAERRLIMEQQSPVGTAAVTR